MSGGKCRSGRIKGVGKPLRERDGVLGEPRARIRTSGRDALVSPDAPKVSSEPDDELGFRFCGDAAFLLFPLPLQVPLCLFEVPLVSVRAVGSDRRRRLELVVVTISILFRRRVAVSLGAVLRRVAQFFGLAEEGRP